MKIQKQFRKRLKSKNIYLTDKLSKAMGLSHPQNGKKSKKYFKDVYRNYCEVHLPTLSESSRVMKLRRCKRFVEPLLDIYMQDITSELMNEFILFSKDEYLKVRNRYRKYNFDKQIKDIKSIFNYYLDTYDPSFYNPVRKTHFRLGVIEEIPKKERKITEQELLRFLKELKQPYKDMALTAVMCAGRVGEVAGIQIKNIDLENRKLHIKEVLVWINGKPKIKNCPKNGTAREVYINDTMYEIFKKWIDEKTDKSPFLFNKKGEAYRYNAINEAYLRAWKKSGLYPKFSGSHAMRYAGAQLSRKLCGSIDAAMAMTGHKSIRMAEKYSQFDNHELNKEASEKVQKFLSSKMNEFQSVS